MRVLLVDDSIAMRRLQRAILCQLGFHEFAEASDADEALGHLESFVPDIILVDRYLQGMDGITLARHLRKACPTTPVIMVSAEASLAGVAEAIKAGVDHYVIKPFTPDLLSQRVAEVIGDRLH